MMNASTYGMLGANQQLPMYNMVSPWSQPGSYVYQTSGLGGGGFGQQQQPWGQTAMTPSGLSYPQMYAPRGGVSPWQQIQNRADAAARFQSMGGYGNMMRMGNSRLTSQEMQPGYGNQLQRLLGLLGGGPAPLRSAMPQPAMQPRRQMGYIDPRTGEVGR